VGRGGNTCRRCRVASARHEVSVKRFRSSSLFVWACVSPSVCVEPSWGQGGRTPAGFFWVVLRDVAASAIRVVHVYVFLLFSRFFFFFRDPPRHTRLLRLFSPDQLEAQVAASSKAQGRRKSNGYTAADAEGGAARSLTEDGEEGAAVPGSASQANGEGQEDLAAKVATMQAEVSG